MAKREKKGKQQGFKKFVKKSRKQLRSLNESATSENTVPQTMILNQDTPGFFFGTTKESAKNSYIGMQEGSEGNILILGGNGSGKSAGIGKPTMKRWRGPFVAIDIKGEHSDYYRKLYTQELVPRPFITWNPLNLNAPSYDPLAWLEEDASENLINNIREIALAIIPNRPNDNQPFWAETERGVFEAALLFYHNLELSFPEIVCKITSSTMTELCEELSYSDDVSVKMLLGEVAMMKPETLACIDRGLRNHLMPFATDPWISHALRGKREDGECFSWKDLLKNNIFLCFREDRIEQWGGVAVLMYTQLIRFLERRPDKFSEEGKNNDQILLLLDEFPRFGKLEAIASAISTLRSKNTNICLMIQSLAQLDQIYGAENRRIICDNCQYKAVLRVDDPETQAYVAKLIGSYVHPQHGISQQFSFDAECTGLSVQSNEIRDNLIQPEELATLKDVLLLTPDGFCRVSKSTPSDKLKRKIRFTIDTLSNRESSLIKEVNESNPNKVRNEDSKILTIKEQLMNVEMKIKKVKEKKERLAEDIRLAQEEEKKRVQRNNFAIGHVVVPYLSAITGIEPEDNTEIDNDYAILEKPPSEDKAQKKRIADRQARKEKRKEAQHTAYAVGEVVTPYIPKILGFEPEGEIKSGDCLKILDQILSELVANPETLSKLRKKAAVFGDQLMILAAILTELVSVPEFLMKIRKKANDIVIIENFFDEIRAKTESKGE